MARIRRWKEKLLLVWFTVFTSFVWARPKSRTLEDHSSPARTLLLTGSRGKRAWAQRAPRMTAQDAISVARRNAQKPGSSFTVLREIVANADTRRVGDQALEQARARKIKLYQKGILADVLRSGGFLLAETEPRTNNAIAFHLIRWSPMASLTTPLTRATVSSNWPTQRR